MKEKIRLNKDGLISLHVFAEGLQFSVMIAAYTEWEDVQIRYLDENFITYHFDSEALCRWCQSHKMKYQILYSMKNVLRNPRKTLEYLRLRYCLRGSTK